MDIKQLMQQMHNAANEEDKSRIADEIKSLFSALPEAEKSAIQAEFLSELDAKLVEGNELIKKIDIAVEISEVSKYISLSKIATDYFGKSKEWLYQRIKGYTVNGKPAVFTDEEREKFSAALQNISRMAYDASLRIS